MPNAIRGKSGIFLGIVACLMSTVACSGVHNAGEQAWSDPANNSMDDADLDFPQYEQWPFDEKEAKRRQQETAARLGISVEQRLSLGGDVHLELVLIPAGRFVMGFEGREGHEPHEVTISKPFYIGALEVTYRQYQCFRQTDKSARLLNISLDSILEHEPHKLDHALEGIEWVTCDDYCRSASEALGCRIRLPTEAEWEYASRAGTTKRFIWDDVLRVGDANAGCLDSVDGTIRPPQRGGQCRANPWGVYDMIGNVSEWVYDKYTEDEYVRVVRDCSSGTDGLAERRPELRTNSFFDGFRVVVEIDQNLLSLLGE